MFDDQIKFMLRRQSEISLLQLPQKPLQARIRANHLCCAVAPVFLICNHFVGTESEQNNIFVSDLPVDLHVRAVQRRHGHGAVHHKFHVSRPGGLFRCRRDLLADLTGRDHTLRQAHAIVRHENNLQLLAHGRIAVNSVRYGTDQLNRVLRQKIARESLCAKYKCPGDHVQSRIVTEPVV